MRSSHKWTNKMETILVEYLRCKLTAAEIAEVLNSVFGYSLTRNAILGKIFRMRKNGAKI